MLGKKLNAENLEKRCKNKNIQKSHCFLPITFFGSIVLSRAQRL
jgi:hypothetical protein